MTHGESTAREATVLAPPGYPQGDTPTIYGKACIVGVSPCGYPGPKLTWYFFTLPSLPVRALRIARCTGERRGHLELAIHRECRARRFRLCLRRGLRPPPGWLRDGELSPV